MLLAAVKPGATMAGCLGALRQGATTRWLRTGKQFAFLSTASNSIMEKSDGLFLTTNRSAGGSGTAPILLGMMSSLSRYVDHMGYFRPISAIPHNIPLKGPIEDPHITLVHSVFGMRDDRSVMTAMTQAEAMELLSSNRQDELDDRILTAYAKYKADKSFVVVEGAALPNDAVSFEVNSRIAKMLQLPVFMSVNCEDMVSPDEAVNSALISMREYKNRKIPLQCIMLNCVDPTLTHRFSRDCKTRLHVEGIQLAGVFPYDRMLGSVSLNEIAQALSAQLLYGAERLETPDVDVSRLVVGTLQLPDLLEHICNLPATPGAGPVILTSGNRLDILFGFMYAQMSVYSSQLAGVILTSGRRPPKLFETLMRGIAMDKQSLPVLLVEPDTYNTALLASKVKANILPSSKRKIDWSIRMWNDNVDETVIRNLLSHERLKRTTPKLFQHSLVLRARRNKRHIVLPEALDSRILQAAAQLLSHDVVNITLLGPVEKVTSLALSLNLDISKANIVDPLTSPKVDRYAQFIFDQRKAKGVNWDMAIDMAQDPTYYGTCMVATGDADGMVSGAVNTTANTVRPALQLIKSRPDRPVVSSVFFMLLPDRVLVYGDCAINVNPTSEELAQIALTSAETAMAFGIPPRVAMLSYATGDSNTGPLIDKVRKGTELAKALNPSLPIEGPIQYDAAVDMSVAKTKIKGDSAVAGQATVLIFPDLNTGNNTYKAVQQATGAIAMGPMLQGLRKPVNDLSRGCTPVDIYNTVVMTATQALQMTNTNVPQQ